MWVKVNHEYINLEQYGQVKIMGKDIVFCNNRKEETVYWNTPQDQVDEITAIMETLIDTGKKSLIGKKHGLGLGKIKAAAARQGGRCSPADG